MSETKLIPHIICQNAAEAVEFYKKAFGAEPLGVFTMPDGKVMHGAINIDGVTIYLVDEFPEMGAKSPKTLGGSPVTLHLQVADCDAVFQRAVDAGAEVRMPLQEMFWGDRYGQLTDPYGHTWSIATTVRQVGPDELQAAMQQMASGGCPEPA
jgi:PhnB protein